MLLAGKYELLRQIATGGMAEVFLARQTGLSGFEKLVCIKRILPERAADPEFVQMFLDEARTAADLRHPNVVDLYEIGEDTSDDQRTLFLAMELVHGHSIRFIQETAAARNMGIPRSFSVQVALDAAHALHYAHQKKDLRGKPLGIVHRDVSPQNILVTFTGATKLCDFGIARAAGRRTTTAFGFVKGKPSYMSPEQATGKPLDARSDLFSLGVVLYELTTGVRLFPHTGPAAAHAVVHDEIPKPTSADPGFPLALEAVLMKMLARDRDQRYPTAAAAAAALEDLLVAEGIPVSTRRNSEFMARLFPEGDDLEKLGESPIPPVGVVAQPERKPDSGRLGELPPADARPTGPAAAAGKQGPGAIPGDVPAMAQSKASTVPEQELRAENLREPTEAIPAGARTPPAATPKSNLPADPGSFVGRTQDLQAITSLFNKGERLVTLMGPGGAGKTRLALRYAESAREEHMQAGGVFFIDLTPARGADDVLRAIGGAISVPLTRGDVGANAQQLGLALAQRGSILLVLDNFEQVADTAPETLGKLVSASKQARFLVTSRERLRVSGESVHEVGALSLPQPGEPVEESEAVQLFVERARAVRHDFHLTEADQAAIAQIVKTLDGLPLAIELAASRMKVFSPQKLLERLPRRFEVLSSTRRDATDRQATLRSAIDWSWGLLAPFEQAALAQASVFRGGFTVEDADGVLDLSAWPGVAWVPDVVQSLRDKSLLRAWTAADTGEIRFGMYESIREYAAEKLAASGAESDSLARHAAWFVKLAGSLADAVNLHGGVERLRRLAGESDNLHAVHRRAARTRDPRAAAFGVRAVLSLVPVYETRGPFSGYVKLADEALTYAKAAALESTLLARLYDTRGWMKRMSGETFEARKDFDAALTLARKAKDAALEGRILRNVGLISWDEAKFEESRVDYARALGIHRRSGDRPFEGRTLGDLANFDHEQGLLGEAQEKYEAAIGILREVGDRRYEGVWLGYLGVVLQERERMDAATGMYERAITIAREFKDRRHESMFVGYLGTLAHERRQWETARRAYLMSIRIATDLGDRRQEGFYRSFLGALEAEQGRLEEAHRCYDIADRELEDRLLLAMHTLNRCHLEIAKSAKSGRIPGDSIRTVEDRVALYERAGSGGWTGLDAEKNVLQSSLDVRIALRLLRAHIRSRLS